MKDDIVGCMDGGEGMSAEDAVEILRERIRLGEKEYMDVIPEYIKALKVAVAALEEKNEEKKRANLRRCANCAFANKNEFELVSGIALCEGWKGENGQSCKVVRDNDFCSYFEGREENDGRT